MSDLLDDWALLIRKTGDLDPELTEELLRLLHDLPTWVRTGENDRIREQANSFRRRLIAVEGPRHAAMSLALMAFESVPFEIDDPAYPEEPFAFRAWRTVEYGFTEMDRRGALDPDLRIFPRIGWKPLET